ncbi:MAG: hypothetical protein KF859_10125 [Phycisphaeraceae bacterium]|nr:hypothetical protein [Phycisphaeraceae bacterium]
MKVRRLSTAAISLTLLAGIAAGQSNNPLQADFSRPGGAALGDGRILERDFSGRGVGNVPRKDFLAEVRMRNSIVTGTAVGGRSFRGDVGYSAPDEFRGALGSDDLFSFRRDSIVSAGSGVGLRGTDSLQYQYSYTTSNQFRGIPTISESGTLSRIGGGPPGVSAALQESPFTRAASRGTVDDFSGLGEGWSRIAPQMNTLRSTSSFESTRQLSPAIVAVRQTPAGVESETASSLLGLRMVQPRKSDRPLEQAVTPPRTVNRGIDPLTGRVIPAETAGEGETSSRDARDRALRGARTAYEDLVERYERAEVRAPAAMAEGDTRPPWQRRVLTLRERLDAMERARLGGEQTGVGDGEETELSPGSTAFEAETLRMIREAGGRVASFGHLPEVDRELYVRYMREGASMLAQGRYFDAEEQFSRCLSVAPGDQTASAARINAQIGAALFLSAGINMRALFLAHPEIVGVRYEGETIPSQSRLKDVAQLLRDRIAKGAKIGDTPPWDASLLLAYVGFQTDDPAVVREGLDLLAASQGAAPDPLVPLLRGVWLEDK